MSEESLRKTAYFDIAKVQHYRNIYNQYKWKDSGKKLVAEMGLAGVIATQLWHHKFLGGELCDLPTWQPPKELASRKIAV